MTPFSLSFFRRLGLMIFLICQVGWAKGFIWATWRGRLCAWLETPRAQSFYTADPKSLARIVPLVHTKDARALQDSRISNVFQFCALPLEMLRRQNKDAFLDLMLNTKTEEPPFWRSTLLMARATKVKDKDHAAWCNGAWLDLISKLDSRSATTIAHQAARHNKTDLVLWMYMQGFFDKEETQIFYTHFETPRNDAESLLNQMCKPHSAHQRLEWLRQAQINPLPVLVQT